MRRLNKENLPWNFQFASLSLTRRLNISPWLFNSVFNWTEFVSIYNRGGGKAERNKTVKMKKYTKNE